MMRTRALALLLLLAACGDDESTPDPADAALDAQVETPLDAGVDARVEPDARADAQVDAQVDARVDALDAQVDARVDAGRVGYGCRLDQDYTFADISAPMPFNPIESYVIKADGRFIVRSGGWGTPGGQCSFDLPACGGDLVDGAELAAALTEPSVLAAFDAGSRVGGSVSVVDTLWQVQRKDGKQLAIGLPCSEGPSCVPIPAALDDLLQLLLRLRAENRIQPHEDGGIDAICGPLADPEIDAALDGGFDAGLDAYVEPPYVPRTGYGCELDQDYSFVDGAPPQVFSTKWSYKLEQGGRFVSYADNNWKTRVPVRECRSDLPACAGEKVNGADLAAALADPVVLAAFRDGANFGNTKSYSMHWVIRRADGKQFVIGPACADTTDCIAVPTAASSLLALLQRLVRESLPEAGGAPTCRDLPL